MAWFTTREAVADALDIASTANAGPQLDRNIAAATDLVSGYLRRRIAPELDTKYLEWPPRGQNEPYWSARLGFDEVISVTEVKADGAALTGVLLEPNNEGPPFTRLEMPRTGDGFTYGDTPQRNLEVTGLFGYTDERVGLGVTAGALTDSVTTVVVSSADVGIGSTLIINDERMTVTDRAYSDTATDLAADLTASMSDTAVTVGDASTFSVGEYILINAEKMRVDAIAGSVMVVRRAEDGTVLAAHTTGDDVYAARTLTVARGAQGTTAAAHGDGDTIERWEPPALIEQLTVAEAILLMENDRAGWARTIGAGDTEQEARGTGVKALRLLTFRTHGRRHRMVAV